MLSVLGGTLAVLLQLKHVVLVCHDASENGMHAQLTFAPVQAPSRIGKGLQLVAWAQVQLGVQTCHGCRSVYLILV